MDTKKIIEKLVKIAEKQQKIINKLAQDRQGLPPDAAPTSGSTFGGGHAAPPAAPPPAQNLQAEGPSKTPARALYDALDSVTKSAVQHIQLKGDTFHVFFKPGKGTQPVANALMNKFKELMNKNIVMPGSYKWEWHT